MTLQEHEIPTVIMVKTGSGYKTSIHNSIIYAQPDLLDTDDTFIDMTTYYVVGGSMDSVIDSEIKDADELGLSTIVDELSILYPSDVVNNIVLSLRLALMNSSTDRTKLSLYFANYLQTILNDTNVNFRINIGKIPTDNNTNVDIDISGVNYFNLLADIYSSVESHDKFIETDIVQGVGRITMCDADVFCSTSVSNYLDTSIYSTTTSGIYINTELTTISGRLTYLNSDIYSTKLGLLGGLNTDLKTRSLFVGNFFIETDRFTTASSTAWIDLIDYLYSIDTDNTYLYVNDVVASGIYFEDIPNGKRLYYNPVDDFYSTGVMVYTVHVESTIHEVEEKNFYLLYGYDLQLNEVVDWGPNNKIVVRITAQNLAFCPNTVGESFDFTTVDLDSINLPCTITAIGYIDLPIMISPQSTAFFYGRTYTVKVKNVKDFAGNVMPDLEYTFTIENPNN